MLNRPPLSPLRRSGRSLALALLCALAALQLGASVEDAVPGVPFQTGDVIRFDQIDRLRDHIPPPFWEHREYFFFEGMNLTIGDFYREYPISEGRKLANEKFSGQARMGRDGSLENYTMGTPFPEIDPSEPDAGVKHAWNMHYKHDALEGQASFLFTYWDNGDQLPLWFEGKGWAMRLANRPDRMDRNGDIFDKEKRMGAGGFAIKSPPDYRGILGLGYAYKANDKPRDEARDVDVWVYVPDLRRVRRISGARRTDPVAGTDMTGEDQGGFSGVVTHFDWEFLGEADVLAPLDSQLRGYPFSRDENYGPYGFSYGNDTWQLRKAIVIEMKPKEKDHIYKRKTLWLDKNTYQTLYAAAYDRRDELWKLIQPSAHWSEREDQVGRIEGINSFLPSSNIVVNIMTGTGVRIEVYDARPTRLKRGAIRKRIDIGRLTKQGR